MQNFQRVIRALFFILKLYRIAIVILFISIFTYIMLQEESNSKEFENLSYQEQVELKNKYLQRLFTISKEGNVNYRELNHLLQSGIDINTQDSDGKTPLFYAAINHNENLFQYLLRHNPDIDIRDNSDKTVFDYLNKKSASYRDFILFKEMQVAKESGISKASVVINYDNDGNIKEVAVSGEKQSSWSPLMEAIEIFDNEKVRFYIENGYDLEKKTNNNSTAIFFAIKFKNDEALDMLLEHGVNIELHNNFNVNPLALAIIQNNLYAVKQLIKYGANIHKKVNRVRTPIQLADVNRRPEIKSYLKKIGAS